MNASRVPGVTARPACGYGRAAGRGDTPDLYQVLLRYTGRVKVKDEGTVSLEDEGRSRRTPPAGASLIVVMTASAPVQPPTCISLSGVDEARLGRGPQYRVADGGSRELTIELADRAARIEVACWSHARTKHWEAAVTTQHVIAREALARIMRMFHLDNTWKNRLPDVRERPRDRHFRVHVVSFFEFVETAYEHVKHQRGMLRSALGYCIRQKDALMRFLDDGALEMTNNRSERQLRRVACGRKAWLFVGSDDHGQAAGNLLTVIASARLHKFDPEVYLRDVFRVLPHWPRDRYLELAPRYWRITRARLDRKELDREIGWLTVPELPLPTMLPSEAITAPRLPGSWVRTAQDRCRQEARVALPLWYHLFHGAGAPD